MTPSFIGLMATMLPGVRPSISFASLPTASTSPVFLLMATIEGSFTTIPLPRAYTSVFAVPRSMARSLEKMLNSDRRLWVRVGPEWNPLFDMTKLFRISAIPRPGKISRSAIEFSGMLAPSILRDTSQPCLNRKFSFRAAKFPDARLLDHNLLLLRIDPAPRGLRGYRDHGLSRGQGRSKVMELSLGRHHRNLAAVHHYPRPNLGLALHFNDVPVLDERVQFQINRFGVLTLGNNREAVLLALHRLFPGRVIGLHHPVISALPQIRD